MSGKPKSSQVKSSSYYNANYEGRKIARVLELSSNLDDVKAWKAMRLNGFSSVTIVENII